MSDVVSSLLVLAAGFLLGIVFFGGLAWTTRRGLMAGNSAIWFLGSWLIRMSIVLVGFHLVAGGNWQRLLLCLTGFILARMIVVRVGNPSRKQYVQKGETHNETQSR